MATIRISEEVYEIIKKSKIHPRVTDDEVVKELLLGKFNFPVPSSIISYSEMITELINNKIINPKKETQDKHSDPIL